MDPAEITAGVREREAKIWAAAGLTVTAPELDRQIKAGQEFRRILAAYTGAVVVNTAWHAGREG